MAGTTDVKCVPEHGPVTSPEDAQFIVDNIKEVFGDETLLEQSQATFTGIRPLVIGNDKSRDFDYLAQEEKELRA